MKTKIFSLCLLMLVCCAFKAEARHARCYRQQAHVTVGARPYYQPQQRVIVREYPAMQPVYYYPAPVMQYQPVIVQEVYQAPPPPPCFFPCFSFSWSWS